MEKTNNLICRLEPDAFEPHVCFIYAPGFVGRFQMRSSSFTQLRRGALGENTIEAVWQKGTPEPEHAGFRKDACGATMLRTKYGKTEQWGWEIDPIKPVARGGTDDLSNLQPLQWENNRSKADDYLNYNCKVRSWREPNPPSAPPLPGPFLS